MKHWTKVSAVRLKMSGIFQGHKHHKDRCLGSRHITTRPAISFEVFLTVAESVQNRLAKLSDLQTADALMERASLEMMIGEIEHSDRTLEVARSRSQTATDRARVELHRKKLDWIRWQRPSALEPEDPGDDLLRRRAAVERANQHRDPDDRAHVAECVAYFEASDCSDDSHESRRVLSLLETRAGNPNNAITLATESLAYFESIGARFSAALCRIALGEALLSAENLSGARDVALEARQTLEDMQASRPLSEARLLIAMTIERSDPERAAALYSEVAALGRDSKDALVGAALVGLAGLTDPPEALELFNQACTLFETLGNNSDLVIALLERSRVEPAAISAANRALEIALTLKNSALTFRSYIRLGEIFEAEGRTADAIARYEKALELKAAPTHEAYARERLGSALQAHGNLVAAGRQLTRARELFIETGETTRASWITLKLGDIALVQGEFEAARRWYAEGATAFRANELGGAAAALGLARVANSVGDVDQALALYRRAIAIGSEHDVETRGLAACELASLHVSLGDVPSARATLQIAIDAFKGTGDPTDNLSAATVRGDIEVLEGRDPNEAYAEALNLAIDAGDIETQSILKERMMKKMH